MKKFKRVTALLTAASISAMIFAGCSDKNGGNEETVTSDTTVSETTVSETATAVTTELLPVEETPEEGELAGLVKTVTPDSTEGDLILADTSFTVVTNKDMEQTELESVLRLNSAGDYILTKTASCTFTLKPKVPLEKNSVASIGIVSKEGETIYRWAFQTDCDMRVDEVYPEPNLTYVSPDTGIEINFTAPVENTADFSEITITPRIDGHFEAHGSTVYFIPHEELAPRTTYYVSVGEGFKSDDGTLISEPYRFKFQTSYSRGDSYFYTDNMSETFIEGDTTCIEVYASSDIMEKGCSVKLYKYPDESKYQAALDEYITSGMDVNDYIFSTEGLECVYSNDNAEILSGNDSWRASFVMLPDDLEQGGYMAVLNANGSGEYFTVQRHIQVDPISVYSGSIAGRSQFFINDTETGNAASGAEITLKTALHEYNAVADSSGVAELWVNEPHDGQGLLTVSYGSNVFCDVFDYDGETEHDPRDDYYVYLYTDRVGYLPTDTINVWGVVRPRRDDVPIPQNLCIGLKDYSNDPTDTIDVTLSPEGTFTTKIVLEDHEEAWTNVAIMSGDTVLCRSFVQIMEYEKPLYILDVDVPEVAVSPQSTPVEIGLTATLYEGTPAEGVKVGLSSYKSSDEKNVVTDKQGKAQTSMLFNDVDDWRPQYLSFESRISGIEDVMSCFYTDFYGFFRDVMLSSEYDSDTKTITLKTSKIDPYALDTEEGFDYHYNYEELAGEAYDTEITATLFRSWYEKTENGSHYDFLQKKTVKDYKYEYKNQAVKIYKAKSQNGTAIIPQIPADDKESSYYFELSWKDTQGREVNDTVYLRSDYYPSANEYVYKYYSFYPDKTQFKENEDITFTLQCNSVDASDEQGRVLLQVYGDNFLESTVYDSTKFAHKMTKDYIPTVNAVGAYFDGRHVYPVANYWDDLCFDPSDRELSVEIAPDKPEYAPADNASVTVTVTDIDGNAVSNAQVMVSVVDEAAFAIADQKADPISDIYEYIYPGTVQQYYSYIQHTLDFNGGGEKGGGGDEGYVRKEFLDTALFMPAVTDGSGKCTVSFKLPDNITQWRVTAVAVKEAATDYVYAGASKYPINSTLPLFVSPIMSDRYVYGDDIAVTAKLFGGTGNDNIDVTLTGEGVNKTLSIKMGETANFGKLEMGDYKVTFTAKNGSASDSVEMPLSVTDSLRELPVVSEMTLEELSALSPERWPVKVVFFDEAYRTYADALFRLNRYSGSRLDMRIGEYYAMREMGFITPEEYEAAFKNIAPTGFAKLLKDSEESAELTALILCADPTLINNTSAARRFNKIVNSKQSSHGDVADAYLGLAALNKPVMSAVRRILSSGAEGFDLNDALKMCAALAMLGDYDNAQTYFDVYTSSMKTEGDMAYFESSNEVDERKLTASALITASMLHSDKADMIARYLVSTRDTYDSSSLELMIYAKNHISKDITEASFTYVKDGKTETVTIDKVFGTTLSFTEEQFKNAELTAVNGSIYTVAYYTGSEPAELSEDITVSKTITAENGRFEKGELVTVSIKVSGKNAKYASVYDVVPSCGRYYDSDNWGSVRGQRVNLYTDKDGNASYTFRLISDGEYVLEGAAARGNGEYALSERSTVTVG